MSEKHTLGKKGEQLAVDTLLRKGYEILETNYRYLRHEIDIIAKKEDILSIVEVKTRSTSDFGNPQDFVKPKQIQSLIKAANQYVIDHDLDVEIRFDIIAIITNTLGTRTEHLEDAFYHF
ncbi:YraN family protein [Aquimarina algicola]|uniref:UPF0102 protein FHK87_18230 n=1 Tax=Aquimarina algicola TaxID=2589995 RepID=A0A504J8M5_9FLAO|nr:YraN family protein [Aquimarina algicola]TPN83903.1 endonuclease [Aquimarina algicola]